MNTSMEDRIDQYIQGTLSAKEKAEFESAMAQDAALAEQVDQYKAIKGGVIRFQLSDMKQRLEELEEKQFNPSNAALHAPISLSRNRTLWLAISSVAAAILVLVLILFPNQHNPEAIFEDLYEPYPNYEQPLVRDSSHSSAFGNAFATYEAGKYQLAQDEFKQLVRLYPDNPDIRFYLGQCYLALGQTDLAEGIFLSLLYHETSYKNPSLWYLALTQVKMQKVREARLSLDKLPDRGIWANRKQSLQRRISQLSSDL